MTQVFISFSSKDAKAAERICQGLEAHGHKCWISSRDIKSGEDFMGAIVNALQKSKMMVLVFSSNCNASKEVPKEVALANNNNLIIVPARIENIVPTGPLAYDLANRHYIDLFVDWEPAIARLANELSEIQPAEIGSEFVGGQISSVINEKEKKRFSNTQRIFGSLGILALTVGGLAGYPRLTALVSSKEPNEGQPTKQPYIQHDIVPPARLPITVDAPETSRLTPTVPSPRPAPTIPVPGPPREVPACDFEIKSFSIDAMGVGYFDVQDSCGRLSPLYVDYQGHSFVLQTNSATHAKFTFDFFAGPGPIAIKTNDDRATTLRPSPFDSTGLAKAVIIWEGPYDLNLHALEDSAAVGSNDDVNRANPRSPNDAAMHGGGIISQLTTPSLSGHHVQVYTLRLPSKTRVVDFRVSLNACAAEGLRVPFTMIRYQNGNLVGEPTKGVIKSAPCTSNNHSETWAFARSLDFDLQNPF